MHPTGLRHLGWLALGLFLLAAPAQAQTADPEINLNGAIDFHAHMGPDSVAREIDADDLARLAKQLGMRGMVMKNHWESTASMVYLMRKEVPGIELFGGVTQDLAVGGINLEAVKHMANVKGGYGRVIWLPTFDSENSVRGKGPQVSVAKDGKILPGVAALLDYIAAHPQLVLETGHVSAEEALLVIREAKARGIKHIVVTHAMDAPIGMTIPQMQQAAADGAFIEFVYAVTLGPNAKLTIPKYRRGDPRRRPQILHPRHRSWRHACAGRIAASLSAAGIAGIHAEDACRRLFRSRHQPDGKNQSGAGAGPAAHAVNQKDFIP